MSDVILGIEDHPVVLEPDQVDDCFRDLVKAFSPTIYKAMVQHDQFYKLQESVYEVAEMTGWEAE